MDDAVGLVEVVSCRNSFVFQSIKDNGFGAEPSRVKKLFVRCKLLLDEFLEQNLRLGQVDLDLGEVKF